MLRVLRRGLERARLRIVTVPDGDSALHAIKEHRPHVVVVDSEIHPMSGEELCRRIQTEFPDRRFLTCVLTSSAEDEHASYAQWFSNFRILEKPVSVRRLLRYIERHKTEEAA